MKEYNNKLTKLGYTIRKWREIKDIKQQELAHKICKDKSWLSHVENGKIDISFTQVMMLADAMNIKPALLFEDFPENLELERVENPSGFLTNNFNDITTLMKEILYSMKEQTSIK